ncbi:hypothetical protein CEXT_486401 [Caerostris extrusa]|uniref:Uncharacterized protein n=1 Tax=Caerostris extrusa TaxID=172846 RepID=A0AAV4RG50_CAEEX|nr:hypothetical protein CEXT_486401 [Caerostris extrusa]
MVWLLDPGYAGDGQNYTSDFNMNKTPLAAPVDAGGALTRRALAAAFNPKGILAQAASPEAAYEYEFIRRDFRDRLLAYKEVTGLTKYDEDVFLSMMCWWDRNPRRGCTIPNQRTDRRLRTTGKRIKSLRALTVLFS